MMPTKCFFHSPIASMRDTFQQNPWRIFTILMHHFLHDEAKTRKALETLFKLFSVLDTTELDCKKATLSPVSDYEDAIMAETALRSGMDCIVTRNLKDYEKSSVQARSPADFLQEIIGPDEEE